ncbi:MAG: RsmB/NOP family class I SAM-dependent RNA methyltransferase [Cytophagales bacterium]|nr:RsmB/NOP family class I SAM-dependent RNA methyltransferase [Cytophagales bacterium]MCA6368132.1 RsmB/NOP family class I SAM-dependent RNA methyltransferase [Cytophagales bacterium]MCA6372057.1 RsmB/NOP family class I SAM-dependent RNA methyltransferase [Cytophagales bacterium]MCA6375765.1 RsmB/NOP family class I SAM-dependent RNA methyltransferase [Cytophagales bacterium]MCA6385631.1 RsmB/NOP family class I SAM-dependent RNA methyltransferase [Cytophagales bacterium]
MKLYRNLCEAVVNGLELIFTEKKYADKVIEKILKSNPKWGARDRRFIAETIYDIVRWYRLFIELTGADEDDYWKLLAVWCLWNKVDFPDWEELKGLNRKKILENYEQLKANRKIRESIPDWLDELGVKELGTKWEKEIAALNEEAKVVLRVNTIKISREELQKQLEELENILTDAPLDFPDALLLEERQNIFTRQQFKDGLFEVQDGGSQLIAPFLQVKPGMRVIDACAGAGGKTLHLAALMQNKGRIIALDTEEWKLDELKKRGRRAGVANVETRLIESSKTIKRLENSADRLLLDVPCSGLGVLKRNPDAKWKMSLDFIEQVKELQQRILADYSSMVKTGGEMVYSTCSLFPSENEKQVETFLKNQPQHFELLEQKTVLPSAGFDGFFMARLKKLK